MSEFFSHIKLSVNDLIADGLIHRFYVHGDKPSSKNGWYVVYNQNPLVGIYGSWKTGERYVWNSCHQNSQPDGPSLSAKMEELKRLRKFETEQRNRAAQDLAYDIWDNSQNFSGQHAYLLKKGVKPFGLRITGSRLLIPLLDYEGELHSLQFIDIDGSKRFLAGGKVTGCFHLIGKPFDILCIAEGYATAATIYETTGIPTAAAFSSVNLLPVAEGLRLRFPSARIVVCADNDLETKGNPGLIKAKEAAQKVGGFLATPPGSGDFNDFLRNISC